MTLDDLYLDFVQAMRQMPPPPKFDRIAACDLKPFADIPRVQEHPHGFAPAAPLLFGFPVVIDLALLPGVLELRKGDEVVHRVYLKEHTAAVGESSTNRAEAEADATPDPLGSGSVSAVGGEGT